MCDEITLYKALDEFVDGVKEILGDKLNEVILYGSYARGDYDEYSDIDVMILADVDQEELKSYRDEVDNLSADLDCKYNILLVPMIQNTLHFNQWIHAYPFYKNVMTEGKILHG